MCFSINILNLLTISAVLMCSGKQFHNLAPWYVGSLDHGLLCYILFV